MHRGVATNLLNNKKKLTTSCNWATSSCLQKMKKNWRLIQTIGIYRQDIKIEFGIEHCAMIIMRRGKKTN